MVVHRLGRRVRRNATSTTSRGGVTVVSVLGAVALLSVGLTPGAVAADAQSQQWYLSAMKTDEMWKVSTGEGVKVAVIDTGVNPHTPSLRGQIVADKGAARLTYKATEDYKGHGTTMAELIVGTGAGGGLKGLAPGAQVVPYRIAMKGLNKAEAAKAPELVDVIKAVADSDAKIISMSFGSDGDSEDELEAIKYAHAKGKLMFAATGNDAERNSRIGYPAAYPYVVGVAASDESGKVAKFSEHGNYVDLAAPGLNMPGWCDNSFRAYCDKGGTSAATALTSASAALVWSAHPDWTANQVLNSLIETAGRDWARDDPSTYLGYGLIRPRKVLENANFDPGPADTDPLARENAVGLLDDEGKPVKSSSSPSTAPSEGPGKTGTSGSDSEADGTSAAASGEDSSDDTTLWVILGAAAAVLAVGGGAFAVIRSRRGA